MSTPTDPAARASPPLAKGTLITAASMWLLCFALGVTIRVVADPPHREPRIHASTGRLDKPMLTCLPVALLPLTALMAGAPTPVVNLAMLPAQNAWLWTSSAPPLLSAPWCLPTTRFVLSASEEHRR